MPIDTVASVTNVWRHGFEVLQGEVDPTGAVDAFRRLQLNASGITEIEVNTTLLTDFLADILSEGNKVFSTSGVEIDGAQMHSSD